jgi:hypothetical protein
MAELMNVGEFESKATRESVLYLWRPMRFQIQASALWWQAVSIPKLAKSQ